MIRRVSREDFDMLFLWRNDDEVIKNSRYQDSVSREQYEIWFNERIDNDRTYMFILEQEEKPVGQVKIEKSKEELLITYSVAKEYRGRGFGRQAISELEKFIGKNKEKFVESRELVAYINANNAPSRRIFERLGYKLKYKCEYYVKYSKELIEI